jgi:hypothetical protein
VKLCQSAPFRSMPRIRFLLLLALALSPAGCSRTQYSAEPIDACVVDKESGAPIEGVSVAATYEMKGGLEGGNVEGYLDVSEATTDQRGCFHFAGWGPKTNEFSHGSVETNAPRLMLFKEGYRFNSVANGGSSMNPAPYQIRSDWNGKTIPLTRFTGSAIEYNKSLDVLRVYLDLLYIHGHHFASILHFLCSGAAVNQALSELSASNALPSYYELEHIHHLRCDPPRNVSEEGK